MTAYHDDDIREVSEIVAALKETMDSLVIERNLGCPTNEGSKELNLMWEAHAHAMRLAELMQQLQETLYASDPLDDMEWNGEVWIPKPPFKFAKRAPMKH